ncbi:DUF4274 domain-containing protein [Thermoflavimicrobium daqui]|nr:DUF4274 domain-containing protein [Thermoflavimicrobium daqui]
MKNLEQLRNLLYEEDEVKVLDEINRIENALDLHILARNINMNDGFQVACSILNNPYCDLGTALLLFYDADGYRLLTEDIEKISDRLREWKEFVLLLYNRIVNDEFSNKHISFIPPLGKVDIYKMKKKNPDIPKVFLEPSPGKEIGILSIVEKKRGSQT